MSDTLAQPCWGPPQKAMNTYKLHQCKHGGTQKTTADQGSPVMYPDRPSHPVQASPRVVPGEAQPHVPHGKPIKVSPWETLSRAPSQHPTRHHWYPGNTTTSSGLNSPVLSQLTVTLKMTPLNKVLGTPGLRQWHQTGLLQCTYFMLVIVH